MIVSLILTTCYLIIFHFNNVLNIYQEAHDISNFGDSIQGNMKNDENVDNMADWILDNIYSDFNFDDMDNNICSLFGILVFRATYEDDLAAKN